MKKKPTLAMALHLEKSLLHKFTKTLILISCWLAVGCTSPEQQEMNEGKTSLSQGQFSEALNHFERVVTRAPGTKVGLEAAREAARIAYYEIKDFKKAIHFYQQLVLSSPDAKERLLAQKQIVAICFDHLTDYQRAVIEINKLIVMIEDPRERAEYKMKLARAYFYQNNFTQAKNETDEFLSGNPPADQKFDMTFLKGNIAVAEKDMPTAITLFKGLLSEFPNRAVKDNVGLTLSVCYEEVKDFRAAIEVLEQLKATHPMPEYIEIRIKRLQERLKNQPGARGRVRK
jgi:tetratricopeptide (TPR) repeat protein